MPRSLHSEGAGLTAVADAGEGKEMVFSELPETMQRSLWLAPLLASLVPVASAQILDEVRVGVADHNVCVINCDNADKESGVDLSAEIVFNSPDFLALLLGPRPYLLASANTDGNTSFAGFGLHWNVDVAPGWSLEPGLGYVVHDGALNFPFPQGDPRNDPVSARTVYFGSRDLFRTSVSINRDLGGPWGVQLMYEHLSHGQIIGEGRNQGLDNIGIRLRYALGQGD